MISIPTVIMSSNPGDAGVCISLGEDAVMGSSGTVSLEDDGGGFEFVAGVAAGVWVAVGEGIGGEVMS